MQYLDLDLEIGAGSGREYPVVVRSPAGEARIVMRFPYDDLTLESRLKDLRIALLRSANVHRKALSDEEQAVQEFGRTLFEALLAGDARALFDVSRATAAQEGKSGVRLRLRIQAPELAALPWEYLYDPRLGDYLCLSRKTPLVRYPEIAQPIQPLKVTPPLRILGMIASPSDQDPLDVSREQERIRQSLEKLQTEGWVELTWLKGQTWEDLQEAMWDGPWHVFHFIGHGGFDSLRKEGVLALANERGNTYLLSATNLARLLADHTSLRLVLLNACEGGKSNERDLFSSTAATLARAGIPAVLAMQEEITDHAAIQLTRTFYRALAHGLPVDAALAEARTAIRLSAAQTLEWGTPILYLRSPDGLLFDLTSTPPLRPTPEPSPGPRPASTPAKTKEQWVAEGEQQRAARQFEAALAAFEQAIALDSTYGLAHRGKSIALFELKRYDEALAAAELAIQLGPTDEAACYNKGTFLLELGRTQEALGAFERAIQLKPDARFYTGKGEALWRMGRYQEAHLAFRAAIQLDPNNAAAQRGLGNVLRKLKFYQDALAAYDRAMLLDPASAAAYIGKAKALRKLKRYQDALDAAVRAIQLSPNNAAAYREHGEALQRLKRYQEALAAYDRAIQLDPRYADAYASKGDTLNELERPQEALAVCDYALQLDPQLVHAHSERGSALFRLKRYQEALAAYDYAIQLDSSFADSYIGKASVLVTLAHYEEALTMCDRAIQLDPTNAYAYSWAGLALSKLKRYSEALDAYERSIQFDPTMISTHISKGQVLEQLGRKAEAKATYQHARELGWKEG